MPPKATFSRLLNPSRDSNSTIVLGSLCQGWTTLSVKNFLRISNQNLGKPLAEPEEQEEDEQVGRYKALEKQGKKIQEKPSGEPWVANKTQMNEVKLLLCFLKERADPSCALTRVWRFMCSRRVNFFPQISQGYGLSPVCDRMCLFRMHWCMAEKLQYGHLNFFLMTVNSLTARERAEHTD